MFFYQDVQKSGSTAAPTKKLFLTNGSTDVSCPKLVWICKSQSLWMVHLFDPYMNLKILPWQLETLTKIFVTLKPPEISCTTGMSVTLLAGNWNTYNDDTTPDLITIVSDQSSVD